MLRLYLGFFYYVMDTVVEKLFVEIIWILEGFHFAFAMYLSP